MFNISNYNGCEHLNIEIYLLKHESLKTSTCCNIEGKKIHYYGNQLWLPLDIPMPEQSRSYQPVY